ncbi:hypothetical protein [Aureimonas sp. N4]|uniref:hypothetical protein n=1 Tax=Aureimonas sp. N4 TaxID=1638165 RepID=UPI0007850902|nr:hypothetical protein [Aureimonas sp. N4]
MAEVHQLVPSPRPYLAGRPWRGPEGGNIVILPCIRRERIAEFVPVRSDERTLARRSFKAVDEADA